MRSDLFDKLRAQLTRPDKRVPKDAMLIVFLLGILIYVALLPTSDADTAYFYDTENTTAETESDYADGLAAQLEEFLSHVEGVGEVRVLIYTTPESDTTYLTQSAAPEIRGIVIAASGATDESLRVSLTRMAMSLYGLEANKIEVLTLTK